MAEDNNDRTQLTACKKLYEEKNAEVKQLKKDVSKVSAALIVAQMIIADMENYGDGL